MSGNFLTPVGNEAEADGFLHRTREVLSAIVKCARDFVGAVPPEIKNSAELARALKLPKKVSWQVYCLAEVNDALVATNFIPGRKPLGDFVEAAKSSGIAEGLCDELLAAFLRFETFVTEVAGSRTAFVTMVGQHAKDPSGKADVDRQHRLMAFKAFSHFSSMQVDAVTAIDFLAGPQEGTVTSVDLRIVEGMRRLTNNAHPIFEEHRAGSAHSGPGAVDFSPLDKEAYETYGVPIIPAFCSRPLPNIHLGIDANQNLYRVQWEGGQVGIRRPTTVTTAIKTFDEYRIPTTGREYGKRYIDTVGYPAKKFTRYWFFNQQGIKVLTPRIRVYLNPLADVATRDRPVNREIPAFSTIQRFESGSWLDNPTEFSPIREHVAHVCARMEWDPANFVIFRMEMDYPIMNSKILCEFPWLAV